MTNSPASDKNDAPITKEHTMTNAAEKLAQHTAWSKLKPRVKLIAVASGWTNIFLDGELIGSALRQESDRLMSRKGWYGRLGDSSDYLSDFPTVKRQFAVQEVVRAALAAVEAL
jgi:hypothetical protein